MTAVASGQAAEDKALYYLQKKGLKLVMRNYSCKLGEIDIIMRDGQALVFIEVRKRTSLGYGGGMGSITFAKRQKIIKSTTHYLMKYKIAERYPLRFDVISIDGKEGQVTWLKDAFSADD
jgi:putative endonuclease